MGDRGPVPNRSEQRRRTNKPETVEEISKVPAADVVDVPVADPDWHSIALAWYESLATSGQARFYEPSDWAVAYLVAESMSRDLEDQVVGITDSGMTVKERIPLKGASLAAYLRAFAVLGVTEGDRRRMSIELQRQKASDPDADHGDATVLQLFETLGGA